VVIEVDERTKWFKLNAGQVGFYRVNYNEEWETFNELLRSHHTVKRHVIFLFNTGITINKNYDLQIILLTDKIKTLFLIFLEGLLYYIISVFYCRKYQSWIERIFWMICLV